MNKRLIKQKIAFIMAIVIMLGTILPADTVHATANEKKITQDTSGTQNIQNGISVDGKNAFGNMLGKELLGKATEQAENDGCNIFSVEMDGQTAKVSFETIESAALVIGIYSEDGTELVTSATKNVSAGETETEVTIEQTLPQYFYLRGFLVDSKTLRPLCTSYETPNYTKEMQEFLAKTVNDFDSDKVLNLDSNPDNNFAVYDTDTIIIPERDGVNKVTKTDDENLVYVIENADESITSLKKDDIFSYQYGDGEVLVVKIASIVKDGTTVTITGADISLEEAFDYVKIDAKAGTEDAKVDKSMMEGGLTYNGLVDEGAKGGLRKSGKFGEIDKEGHTGKSLEYKLNDIETDSGNVKISGGININFDISFKINISLRYQYCELKLDYSVKVHASITGKLPPFKIAIGYIAVDPVPGVVGIGFIPYFNLEASGEIEYTGTLSGTVGACASNKTGLENLTTNPKFESEIKGEITVFAGIEIEPIITLFHKKTDKYLKIQAAAGCEVHALFIKAKADNPDKIHACKNCISGEIYGKLKLDINSEFIKNGIHKSPKVKISDFYYSFDFNEFSFKTCPHYKLKADIIVTDSDGKGLKDVTIKGPFSVNKNGQDKIAEYAKDLTDADHITTNAMGKAFGYLTTGEHTLELNADGYEAQNEKIEVKDETNNLRIMLKKSSTLPDVKPSAIPIESLVTEPPAIPSLNPDSLSTTADIMISLGEYHSGAVTKDGSLYMWGCNDHGQLGDNTITDKNKPVKVLDNVVSVSLGGEHSGAITKDGSLYMWGLNNCGQLGDGTVADAHKPVKVLDNVALVSLGKKHSGAVTKDGSLYMWGCNKNGQLGDGTETDKNTPVKVLDNVASVDLGSEHSGAVTKDGSLYMWGYSASGQLGYDTVTDTRKPAKVLDNVALISLGGDCSGAVTKDGSLYMWGDNFYGELGDGTRENKHKPVKVLNNVALVSLGDEHSGAVTKDGSLYMWGVDSYGKVGVGSTDRPTKMLDNVALVSLGDEHSGAITKDGSLYMWGYDLHGQLGDGMLNYGTSIPVRVMFEDTVSAASYRSKPLRGAPTLSESFTGLLPGKYYNFYVLKSRSAKNLLSADNVLYMAQYVADSTGKIDVTYNINKISEYDKPFVVGMHGKRTILWVPSYKKICYYCSKIVMTTSDYSCIIFP